MALYTTACIQNFSCAVLISPFLSKYQLSHPSGVDFREDGDGLRVCRR